MSEWKIPNKKLTEGLRVFSSLLDKHKGNLRMIYPSLLMLTMQSCFQLKPNRLRKINFLEN